VRFGEMHKVQNKGGIMDLFYGDEIYCIDDDEIEEFANSKINSAKKQLIKLLGKDASKTIAWQILDLLGDHYADTVSEFFQIEFEDDITDYFEDEAKDSFGSSYTDSYMTDYDRNPNI
jgi:hypothetical protein